MSRSLRHRSFVFACAASVICLCCCSVLADSVLNFPRLSFEPNTLTGIAIVNPSDREAVVTLTAYGAGGTPLSATGLKNPVQLTVEANQQTSKLTSELFGSNLPAETVAWFQATSSVESLTGFFLFLNTSLTIFDGADLPASSSRFAFNQMRVDSGYSTELNIINPGTAAANATLSLVGSESSSVNKNVTLPAKGVVRLDAAAFFGVSSVSPGAYVVVTSDVDVAGFEFVKSRGDLLGLNAKAASELLTNLYFPQMAVLGPWKTELGLVNYSSSPAIVTISAYKGDGTLYGSANLKNNPVTRSLAAGASLREDVETTFGFSGSTTLDGWIKVESTASAINGYVSYGLPAAGSVAAVASAVRGQTRAIFSHIATTAGFFTGVAFLNPGSLAANVRVLAIRADGQVLGSFDMVLQPGQRTSKLINELVRAAEGQAGGLIWVKSDQAVYLTSLFGTASVLANIPAQTAPDSYQPDRPLPALKLNPSLAVVQPNTTQVFQAQGATGNLIWKVNGIEGGNASVGVISPTGRFQGPNKVPSPQSVTISAEGANQIAAASVDVLEKTSLVSGLGVVQSVTYLGSLKKLYAAELATISTGKPIPLSAQTENSTIFEVSPTTKTSIAGFSNENIPKIISFSASDGKEYLLAAGKTSGKVFRINLTTRQSQEVVTGLNQPTVLVIDPQGGGLLIAEADKISVVQKPALETGLSATKQASGEIRPKAATLFPAIGSAGIAVDNCNGNIYVSDSPGGRIIEYARSNGQTRTFVSALNNPRQLLAIYRNGLSCPGSFQLLVVEQGAGRITLVTAKDGSLIPWLPLAGVNDLALIPTDNPLTQTDGVLVAQVTAAVGEIATVVTPDIYKVQPVNPPPKDPCLERVVFADANLEAAVRAALNIGAQTPITCELAKSLTSLEAVQKGIKSLAGLESFSSLRTLSVEGNSISDINPLSGLQSLTFLSLGCFNCEFHIVFQGRRLGNLIRDITPLSGLSGLKTLLLDENMIQDLTPISKLTGLNRLEATENLVSDIRPLSGLTGLSTISFSNLPGGANSNKITDIKLLSGLTELKSISLFGNPVTDISPLSSLTKLEVLYLGGGLLGELVITSQLSDITPLAGLVNLTWLSVGGTSLSDIRPVSRLTKLRTLFLTYNRISDIGPLSGLGNLYRLYLFSNSISNIRPLAGLQNLYDLSLDSNSIVDITPLSGLTNLGGLTLSSNAISDIRPLVSNPGLGRDG